MFSLAIVKSPAYQVEIFTFSVPMEVTRQGILSPFARVMISVWDDSFSCVLGNVTRLIAEELISSGVTEIGDSIVVLSALMAVTEPVRVSPLSSSTKSA